MGIQEQGRMSLKRISNRFDDVARKVKAVAIQYPTQQNKQKARTVPRRPDSQVSDLEESSKLSETNALNEAGMNVILHIAEYLQRRVDNEDRVNADDKFSKGEGRVPPVALDIYMTRLARYINVWSGHRGGEESAGVRAGIMAAMYLNKLEEVQPDYALNKFNVHRLTMTAFLVATKFTEDYVISNDFWAKVGGVKPTEINMLEGAFCNMMHFELYLDENLYAEALSDFSH